jgi:FKBP-type peptidyl-prolyl cis-trans isomerase FklB
MRRLIFSLAAATILSASASAADLKTDQQRFSYIIGMQIGQQMKKDGITLDEEAFMQAIRDAASGTPSRLSQEEAQTTMQHMQEERAKVAEQEGEKNKQAGEKFLADNRGKPGVKVLPNGLQYKVLKAGTGAKPSATDTVEVNYRGTLIDGTEFDSSYKRGQPATFPVNGVIKGWTQALQMMNEGSKWQLFIPADLAYGSRGAGGVIGPNATLVFEVELLKIKK